MDRGEEGKRRLFWYNSATVKRFGLLLVFYGLKIFVLTNCILEEILLVNLKFFVET